MPRDLASAVTVTVVDDEPLVAEMLVRAAACWNYRCQTALSVGEALQLFEKNPTPILVTDLHMPGTKGTQLVEEVHRRWPRTSIIVLTGAQDYDAAIQCLNAGASRYFPKPIKLEEFRHVLAASLHTYELQRERDTYQLRLERTVARQTRKLRQHFLATVNSHVRALEARDPYTSGHSLRVRLYALMLAEALGLDRQQRRCLGLAAKLHDLGKIALPETILNKPGKLTPDEMEIVRGHPVIGERILAPVLRNAEVLRTIRGHHERLDGSGYPDALVGDRIPVLARVLAVADCYDALTSARSYRKPLPFEAAFDLLNDQAGSQYDPHFVRVFVEMIAKLPPEKSEAFAQIPH